MEWMDTLRGGAILLMLFWHATSLPVLYQAYVPGPLLAVNDALLPYRMPCLMFLSGLLLPRSLSKPLGEYYRGKIALIAYPYVVWVIIYCLCVGADRAYWDPRLYVAKGYLWYLYYIAVFYLVAPLVRRLPLWVTPVACFAAAFVVDDKIPHRMLFFAIFFFTGAWAAGRVITARLRNPWLVVALAVPAIAFAWVSATRDVNYQQVFVLFSFAGIAVAIALAARMSSRRSAALRHVGRNSIVYYTSHFPAMLGVLMLLLEVGAPWWVTVPVLYAVGIAVGTALTAVRERRPVRWLFEAPFLSRGPRPAGRPAAAPTTPPAAPAATRPAADGVAG
ncbi:acyltransferase family protein [Cellulomonas edaphi]|uniref:Acyltransferase n=1 Tax=Cellulomonas edaphi TaxID=3053468 RepID=A0ABT7S502_9CELL|nr:acyltransferase [Cellulomons edaphi]MDM7830693.1 acyltransferase [Cellulomons edaphi]